MFAGHRVLLLYRPNVDTGSFIHSFIQICSAHCVENVESEAVARWSFIGKVVSF